MFQVMVGELPQDFLRVGGGPVGSGPVHQQVLADQQAAAALQSAQGGFTFMTPNLARLTITVCQVSKLTITVCQVSKLAITVFRVNKLTMTVYM